MVTLLIQTADPDFKPLSNTGTIDAVIIQYREIGVLSRAMQVTIATTGVTMPDNGFFFMNPDFFVFGGYTTQYDTIIRS